MKEDIEKLEISGEILDDEVTLNTYSHDASLFEVKPALVVYPKNAEDVKRIVKYVSDNKKSNTTLSVTARSAGSCMSGGSLNESIILDFTKHISGIEKIEGNSAVVYPGTFYRDFEIGTLKKDLILPCYTASKNLCALGGMIGNNAAGEKTLSYGKMENYVETLDVVFSDGNEYEVRPLSKEELDNKISHPSESSEFESGIYKKIWELIQNNKEEIERSKPNVSKNSAGYYIWNVWDGKTFNLNKLLVGSQGTLGIVTKAKLKLVPIKKESKLLVIFLKDLEKLGEIVNTVLPLKPESIESYDDETLKLAIRFFPEMVKNMHAGFLKLMWDFLPEAGMILTGGFPKLIILVEFAEDLESKIEAKMDELEKVLEPFDLKTHRAQSGDESEKYWTIRRESFNLLRKHIHGRRTAPFVDDVVVEPKYLPEFLPKMRKILDDYKLLYTIAGHAGNGNFHVIPLMDMREKDNVRVITEVSEKIYNLVGEYNGSITGEHNDGIIRTPYLGKMYSPRMLEIFQEIKNIFDTQNIFNPGKKVNGSIEYLKNHLARE